MTPALRSAAAMLAVVVALGIVGCGRAEPHDDATSTGRRGEARVCAIIEVPRKRTMGGRTFAQLLALPPSADDLAGTAAAVVLLRSRHAGDLGAYEPAIDHLVALGEVVAGEREAAPEVSAVVTSSARRLDQALADGLCT